MSRDCVDMGEEEGVLWYLGRGVWRGDGEACCEGGVAAGKDWLNLLKLFSSLALSVVPPTALVFVLKAVMVFTPSQTSLMLFALSFCSTFLL